MLRHASLLSLVLAAVPTLVAAQGHPTHHHPRGAKIIMIGTLVNPTCAFVQQAADSAQSRCVQQQRSALPPVLMGDGELYVLDFSQAPAPGESPSQAPLGKRVKIDGTVYPAGSSYLIVVDSMRVVVR